MNKVLLAVMLIGVLVISLVCLGNGNGKLKQQGYNYSRNQGRSYKTIYNDKYMDALTKHQHEQFMDEMNRQQQQQFMDEMNRQQQQQFMDEMNIQQQQQFMDDSMKSVTPFEHGGYDLNQGNSFNDFNNFNNGF